MKRYLRLLLSLALTCALVSCETPGTIHVDNVAPLLTPVLARHDAMLNGELNPANISAEDKATYLRSTQILRDVIEAASPKPPTR